MWGKLRLRASLAPLRASLSCDAPGVERHDFYFPILVLTMPSHVLTAAPYVLTVVSRVLRVQFIGSNFEQGDVTGQVSKKNVFTQVLFVVAHDIHMGPS